jgi:hypothetical protein
MTREPPGEDRRGETVLELFHLDDTAVVMIADVENEHAWIQSSDTVPVER